MIEKIVSGGQTGVDRGALDAALDSGFPCGGWCPRGRRAEDGRIPGRYPLEETASRHYVERTRRNVRDSDATLALAWGEPGGGTGKTVAFAERMAKPCLVLDMGRLGDEEAAARAGAWIAAGRFRALNVAGPRASSRPDAEDRARRVVALILAAATPRRS